MITATYTYDPDRPIATITISDLGTFDEAQLRAALEKAEQAGEWEEAYEHLLGAFELHLDILECKQALADYVGILYDVILGDIADEFARAREGDGA